MPARSIGVVGTLIAYLLAPWPAGVGANDAVAPVCVTLALYFFSGALSYGWEHRAARAFVIALSMSCLGIAAATWYASRRITVDFGVDGAVRLAGAYTLWVVALGATAAMVGWTGWWAVRLARR
jgi:hypothetical protein